MKQKAKPTPDRLGGYLTAVVSVGTLAGTADAAIVNLDVSSITGVNAGLTPGFGVIVALSTLGPGLTGDFFLMNDYFGYFGIDGASGASIAFNNAYASPRNFPSGTLVDYNASFTNTIYLSSFSDPFSSSISPDFGPGSFMGFRSANGNYGWLEVLWTRTPGTFDGSFEILSGAFEDVAGVGILAGATAVSAIPEPSSALATIGLLAGGMMIRRRKQAA